MSSSVVVQPEAEELLAFTTSTAPQIVKLTTKKPNKKWKKTKKNTLALTDIVFSTTFLTALVVGCWRGLWGLMDVYSHYFPYGEAYILSMVCQMIFTYSQTGLHKMFVRNRSQNRSLLAECFAKIYTCLSCVICILNWQSGWSVYDYHMKILGVGNVMTAPGSVLIMTIVSAVCLMMVKGLINTIACPFVIALDEWNDIFTISTRFQTKVKEGKFLYFLDCLFSVLIVGTLVVFVWRGAWVLADLHLFPDDFVTSSWASLIIGYGSVVIAFALQPAMKYLCDRLTGLPRLLAADLFILFSLFSTVNVWRGIWNLLDLYFLPDNLELSCWITHSVCLVLLFLLGCSNSLLVRGVYIDAEEPAGKCVVFPCYYLRVLFQQERQLKISVAMQTADLKEVMEAQNNHVVISTVLDNHTKF